MAEKPFYAHLHCFRGISIILIVAAHSWSAPIFLFNNFEMPVHLGNLFYGTETLFHGSTIYFAIISGMLYSLVLRDKGYKRFFAGKFKYVFVPFVVASFCYLFLWYILGYFNPPPEMTSGQLAIGLSMAVLSGQMSMHLWYMPIIMLIFMLTPLLAFLGQSYQRATLILFLLLPLVISRVWPDFSLATLVYFIGPYLVGMVIGSDVQAANRWMAKRQYILWSVFIVFTIIYFILLKYEIKFVEWRLLTVNAQETATYLLRMSFAVILLRLLHQWVRQVPVWVSYLADNAFAIYFIHSSIIILLVNATQTWQLVPVSVLETLLFGILAMVLSILLSIGISWLIQKISGRYSRLIVGA